MLRIQLDKHDFFILKIFFDNIIFIEVRKKKTIYKFQFVPIFYFFRNNLQIKIFKKYRIQVLLNQLFRHFFTITSNLILHLGIFHQSIYKFNNLVLISIQKVLLFLTILTFLTQNRILKGLA